MRVSGGDRRAGELFIWLIIGAGAGSGWKLRGGAEFNGAGLGGAESIAGVFTRAMEACTARAKSATCLSFWIVLPVSPSLSSSWPLLIRFVYNGNHVLV